MGKTKGRIRPALIAAALLVVIAGVALAGGWMLMRKPNPETASIEAVLRWLVVADISTEPADVQISLVRRLEKELSAGLDVAPGAELTSSQQSKLNKNIKHLKRVWFVDAVEQHHQLSAAKEPAFLDHRIDTVMSWAALEQELRPGDSGEAATSVFFNEIQDWIRAERDAALRDRMESTVQDGVVRWLSTHSLDKESQELRRELALRIAAQLEAGLELASIERGSAAEAKRLEQNAQLLMESWLRHQARLFDELPPEQQPKFVSGRIEDVMDWGVLKLFAGAGENADQTASDQEKVGALELMALSQQWIEDSPPEERGQLRALLSAVQAQMLVRMLRRGS